MADTEDDRSDDDGKRPTYETDTEGKYGKDSEHQQALERLQLSAEAYNKQQQRETNALRFQVPVLQWSKEASDNRAGETLGDITIPRRPTLSIPKIDQAIQIVLNQEKSSHFGVSVHASDEHATDENAEHLTGIYRDIEQKSRAGLARSWAFERAVKAGRGCWRVYTVKTRNFRETGDQDIRIGRMLYQEAAYFDPFATEPDWCDGEWGLELEWVSWSKYKAMHKGRKFKKATFPGDTSVDMPSRLSELSDGELTKLQDMCPDWIRGEGEGRGVLVGAYMYMQDRPESDAKATAQGWRPREYRRVAWRKMNAIEFMEYGTQHFSYIPMIPAIGHELIPFDAERRWVGMYEPNMDGQRFFNYAASTLVETMAKEPGNTWVIAEGQDVGHEREFLLANVRNFYGVHYKPTALEGNLVGPPMRQQADTSKLGMALQALQMANEFIHAGTFTPDSALGNASPNARTKGGTLALQQQSEVANSNWLDNQAEISMTYEAKVVLSGIPFYYDRPGRVQRILGIEEKDSKTVILGRPYRMAGKRPQALPYTSPEEKLAADQAVANPEDKAELINLSDGEYGSVVSIGKGYKSRVDQGADELGQLFQAEPELFKILGDIYLRFRDFPGHTEAADRIKKLLPRQLQDQDGEQDPKIQLEQAKMALQQMQAELEKLQPERLKAETQVKIAQLRADVDKAKAQADVHLQAMKDATQIAVAKIGAAAKGAQVEAEAEDEAIALGREHAFQTQQGEIARQHEAAAAGMAAGTDAAGAEADHQRALEQGQAEHGQAQELADQGQAHALEQGDQAARQAAAAADQAHGQTLEQQQQAAELAPKPAAGGE